jgi:hypothetical protein
MRQWAIFGEERMRHGGLEVLVMVARMGRFSRYIISWYRVLGVQLMAEREPATIGRRAV